MKNAVKPLVITLAVVAVLGGILAFLLISGNDGESSYNDSALLSALDFLEGEDESYPVTAGSSKDLISVTVTRDNGGLLFTRKEDFSEDSTCYHNIDGLGTLKQDNTLVSYLVDNLAVLVADKFVEENPDDLSKYGLDFPKAIVSLDFEDGEDIEISFGIRSPSDEKLIYCEANGFVFMVNYYAVEDIFSNPQDFAELELFSKRERIEQIKIERSDFEEPVVLRYLSSYANADEGMVYDETAEYEFVEPFRLMVDPKKGKKLYSGLMPLQMDSCEFVEKSAEKLTECGFDTPTAVVSFSASDIDYVLTIGGKLADGAGYYAILSNVDGIYSISEKSAVWADFSLSQVVSLSGVTPYILGCESVEVSTEYAEYVFVNNQNRFSLNGNLLEEYTFRVFFEMLSGLTADELYTRQTDGAKKLSVRFNYNDKYSVLYGREYDEYSLYDCDSRKYVMNLNGDTVFKVNAVNVQKIFDRLTAITSG